LACAAGHALLASCAAAASLSRGACPCVLSARLVAAGEFAPACSAPGSRQWGRPRSHLGMSRLPQPARRYAAPPRTQQRLKVPPQPRPWARLQARVQQRAGRAQAVPDRVGQLEAGAVGRPVQVDVRLRQVLVQDLRAAATSGAVLDPASAVRDQSSATCLAPGSGRQEPGRRACGLASCSAALAGQAAA